MKICSAGFKVALVFSKNNENKISGTDNDIFKFYGTKNKLIIKTILQTFIVFISLKSLLICFIKKNCCIKVLLAVF